MAHQTSSSIRRAIAAPFAEIVAKHKARRSTSGCQIALADTIDSLHPEKWDEAATAGGFFMQRRYLRMLEQNGPDELTPCYALIIHDGKPLAAMAAQWLDFDGARVQRLSPKTSTTPGTAKGASDKWLKPLARKARSRVKQRVLVCGNILSWGCHGVSFAPGTDVTLAWSGVTDALYRLRRASKLVGETDFVLVKDITCTEEPGFPIVKKMGYHQVETEPNMVLELKSEWRSFDDYLAALASKYRKSAKQIEQQTRDAGYTVEHLTDVRSVASRLHELYEAVHFQAPIRLATLPPDFWASFAECAGDDLLCSVVRRDNHIVGFVNTLRDNNTAIGYQIGFDRTEAETAPIYLRLLQATIADAISLGCTRLSLGRTALEPKARMGATPEPMKLWLKHRLPALNWLVKGIVGRLPHEDAPERNPFK